MDARGGRSQADASNPMVKHKIKSQNHEHRYVFTRTREPSNDSRQPSKRTWVGRSRRTTRRTTHSPRHGKRESSQTRSGVSPTEKIMCTTSASVQHDLTSNVRERDTESKPGNVSRFGSQINLRSSNHLQHRDAEPINRLSTTTPRRTGSSTALAPGLYCAKISRGDKKKQEKNAEQKTRKISRVSQHTLTLRKKKTKNRGKQGAYQ